MNPKIYVPVYYQKLAGIGGLADREIEEKWMEVMRIVTLTFLKDFWVQGALTNDQKKQLGAICQGIIEGKSKPENILDAVWSMLHDGQKKKTAHLYYKIYQDNVGEAIDHVTKSYTIEQKAVYRAYMRTLAL